jgi:hypothetical protein
MTDAVRGGCPTARPRPARSKVRLRLAVVQERQGKLGAHRQIVPDRAHERRREPLDHHGVAAALGRHRDQGSGNELDMLILAEDARLDHAVVLVHRDPALALLDVGER